MRPGRWVGPGNSFPAQGGRSKARNGLPRVFSTLDQTGRMDLFTGSTGLVAGSALELSLARDSRPRPQDVRRRHLGRGVGRLIPGLSFSVCPRRVLYPKHGKGIGACLPLPQLRPGANQKPGWWQSLSPASARGFAFSRFQGPRCLLTERADRPG